MNSFIRSSACYPVEGKGESYRHTFGGQWDVPIIPYGGSAPCHLLYTIDTEDPLFPVRIDGTRFLPLIYCPQYNAAAMAYRVERGVVTVDGIETLEWSEDFPYAGYPRSFPLREVKLIPADQDVLGLLEKADEDTGTTDSRFGGWHWLCQGVPDAVCRNPKCGKGSMDVFGVIYNEPVKGVRIWDQDEGWCDTEIIYQICSDCSSIQVCNRCT